jgi:hypothetical protein
MIVATDQTNDKNNTLNSWNSTFRCAHLNLLTMTATMRMTSTVMMAIVINRLVAILKFRKQESATRPIITQAFS